MTKKIRVAGFYRKGKDNKGANRAHFMAVRGANAFTQMSGDRWDVRGFGCAMPPEFKDCNVSPPFYGAKEMRLTWSMLHDFPELLPVDQNNIPIKKPDWNYTHLHMFGGNFPGQCGQANLGGTVGRTNTDYPGCGLSTHIHEMGHNYNLGHSNTLVAGEVKPYKDKTGFMGSSVPSISNHAAHQYHLGFYDEDEIFTATKNLQVAIIPWEINRRARHDEEYAFVMVPTGGHVPKIGNYILLSTRKTKGYPWLYNSRPTNDRILFVHNPSQSSVLLATLHPRDVYKINDVTIKYEGYKNETSFVDIEFKGDNTAKKFFVPTNKLEPWADAPGSRPTSGLYYNPNIRGQGIDFHTKGDRAVLYWYTQTDGGNPDWFFAEFGPPYKASAALFAQRGTWEDPNGKVEEVGKVRFLEHNGKYHLDWDTIIHGKNSLELQKIEVAEQNGIYFNPERKGEGFSLRFVGNRAIGYFYTHRNATERDWYHFEGPLDNLNMYRTSGAFIRYNRDEDFLRPFGSATIEFINDTQFIFRFNNFETKVQRLF